MAEIIREIDEELRRDKLKKHWREYGRAIVAAVVVLVLAVGGFQGWRYWEAKKRLSDATAYAIALEIAAENDSRGALTQLAAASEEAGDGYAMLMRFQAAALKADSGDLGGAVADYERIASDTDIDLIYRDLAVVLMVQRRVGSGDPAAMLERITPLTGGDRPFRYSALEIAAALAMSMGDTGQARALLTQITDDLTAPSGARGRAAEMLAATGG